MTRCTYGVRWFIFRGRYALFSAVIILFYSERPVTGRLSQLEVNVERTFFVMPSNAS
jgi:hypothetical protein